MKKVLIFLNILSIIIGSGSLAYLLIYVDITVSSYIYVWWFIGAFAAIIWGFFAIFLYLIRKAFLQERNSGTFFIRSERQALFLALLSVIHISLQSFMIWNLFSAILLTLIIVILESYFLNQENEIIKLN